MSHGVVCNYHYRGKLSLWLTSVTVWLFCRDGVAESPCRCGSVSEIYITNAEKKYVIEALLQGNIELVKRNDAQSEEAYVMMRKFALILLRDIMQDNDSLVRREFSNLLTPKDEAKIREAFIDPFTEPDDDIR